jgi:hypothetical protein
MIEAGVMKAQADTLQEWADLWRRYSMGGGPEGAAELGYQLARLSRLARSIANTETGEPVLPAAHAEEPDEDRAMHALREG